MAIAYLAEGSTTLAAAAWSDATGFANDATLVIERGGQTITTALDQSALGTGINYLQVRRTFTGNIGSSAAGPLKVDADAGSDPNIVYAAAAGSFYLQAGGGSALVSRMECNTGGQLRLVGGTFTNVDMLRGAMSANGSTVITNLFVTGGEATIEDNATAITNLEIFGGTVTLRRGATNVTMRGGRLILDADGRSLGPTVLDVLGGEIVWISGAIPGGSSRSRVACSIDVSRLRRDAAFAATNATTVYPAARGIGKRAPGATLTWTTANIIYRGTSQMDDMEGGGG